MAVFVQSVSIFPTLKYMPTILVDDHGVRFSNRLSSMFYSRIDHVVYLVGFRGSVRGTIMEWREMVREVTKC